MNKHWWEISKEFYDKIKWEVGREVTLKGKLTEDQQSKLYLELMNKRVDQVKYNLDTLLATKQFITVAKPQKGRCLMRHSKPKPPRDDPPGGGLGGGHGTQ